MTMKDKKKEKRLTEIRNKVDDNANAWYGLGNGKEDVIYLLSLIEDIPPATKLEGDKQYKEDMERFEKLIDNTSGMKELFFKKPTQGEIESCKLGLQLGQAIERKRQEGTAALLQETKI